MKRFNARPAMLVLVLAAIGCGRDSLESLRKQQVETVTEAVHVLVDVRDHASAEKAKPKLKRLGDQWRDLDKRVTALPAVSTEDEARAKATTEQLDGLILRYVVEAARVAFVPGGKGALDEIGTVKKTK